MCAVRAPIEGIACVAPSLLKGPAHFGSLEILLGVLDGYNFRAVGYTFIFLWFGVWELRVVFSVARDCNTSILND